MPAGTVLAGLSMGASVAAPLLGEHPETATAGLLLLHNTGSGDAAAVRPGLPMQLHIADPDMYQATAEVAAWEQGMTDAGAAVQVFRYGAPGTCSPTPASPTTTAKAPPSPGNVA